MSETQVALTEFMEGPTYVRASHDVCSGFSHLVVLLFDVSDSNAVLGPSMDPVQKSRLDTF